VIKPLHLILSFISLVLLQACTQIEANSGSSYSPPLVEQPKTAEELRVELLQREQNAPEEYLKTTGIYRRNFIDQLVLEGEIANSASVANFKDPVLTVNWYSKTHTKLDTKQYRIFELIQAHHSIPFKLKTEAPSYVASVSMEVLEATLAE
jgi:hypothetical protein